MEFGILGLDDWLPGFRVGEEFGVIEPKYQICH